MMETFNTLLVANRGEIACRVMRTARRLGLRTVAVFHHLDRGAPHVAMADTAVELDGATPTGAYLDCARIIAAAQSTGAGAIHPGYGFLSENAAFAAAVEAAGLVFVGPSPATISLMGEKISARDFARAQGLPLAPSIDLSGDDAALRAAARAVGFPLLVKASAGGGGKGMKIVRGEDELRGVIALAQSEARRYFGNDAVYAERLIERPRHIEVQLVGDGTGRVVHFGERECSLQRRYQKVVEEAPAPNLAPALRGAICDAAVKLAAAARYRNAGTVEFVLAEDGAFYFLEMNTRLQVEHPVTEMVYGVDLVEWQLTVAAGRGLPADQSAIAPHGHAIECRLCAEEPARDFRPAVGRIALWRPPTGDGVRVDGGIVEGQQVTPAFDSMLAKIIAHGADRAAATARLHAAVSDLGLLGVANNADYLARLTAHPGFAAGKLHTGFLADHTADLTGDTASAEDAAIAAAAGILALPDMRRVLFGVPEPFATIGAWRN